MALYAFTGKLTDVNGEMPFFMPGLAVGTFFTGTMLVEPQPGNPTVKVATFHVMAAAHMVNAQSIGLDPLQAFARHTPTGSLSLTTVHAGAMIDNVFYKIAVKGASLGEMGFTVQGKAADGTTKAGAAIGTIKSLAVA